MTDWDDEVIGALVVSLCEPLLSVELLTGIHASAGRAFQAAPQMARTWSAGLLSDVLHTLPAGDPWRNPHDTFGTWQDGADLIPPAHANLFVDVGLVALADPLPTESADLIRHVTGDLDTALDGFAADVHDADLYDTVLPALRWVTWRRRAYVGPEDPYVMLTGFEWLTRARLIIAGQPWSRQKWQDNLKAGRIPDEEYHLATDGPGSNQPTRVDFAHDSRGTARPVAEQPGSSSTRRP